MSEQKSETVSGAFVLAPSAGKKLIGMAVAELPEVRHAFANGRLAIANGTTTACVIEALTGNAVRKFEYCVGAITDARFTENPDNDHTLMMWEKGKLTRLPFAEFLTSLRKFERDDVFIKGANAIDPYGNAGGLQTNPNGGSWADAFGLVTARGFHCIVPVGLEKMIPSVIDASEVMGQMRIKYCMGNPAGLIPLTTFKIITEIEALEYLSGVIATPVAGGGIAGYEGAKSFVVEGTEEQVKKAFSIVRKIIDEPPVRLEGGKVEAGPDKLPAGL